VPAAIVVVSEVVLLASVAPISPGNRDEPARQVIVVVSHVASLMVGIDHVVPEIVGQRGGGCLARVGYVVTQSRFSAS